MSDPVPTPRKVPPLAIVVVVVLVALAVVAFDKMSGRTHAPTGSTSPDKAAATAPAR